MNVLSDRFAMDGKAMITIGSPLGGCRRVWFAGGLQGRGPAHVDVRGGADAMRERL